ncbi:MAG: hypothetical protein ACI97D_000840, partial [Porticoccaceae bacterium]
FSSPWQAARQRIISRMDQFFIVALLRNILSWLSSIFVKTVNA